MIAFTVPLLFVFLLTSQYINAYPSGSSIGSNDHHHPINPRLKRAFGLLQRHEAMNNVNDDTPFNYEENLPYIYPIIQQAYRKRLIDF
jgi:hypothetical protein